MSVKVNSADMLIAVIRIVVTPYFYGYPFFTMKIGIRG